MERSARITTADQPPGVLTNQQPCGLYVHIPFCETKCGYCDFYSVALKGRNTAPLVEAVIRELDLRLQASPLPIRTIFCGGGTPTLLPIEQLHRLLNAIGDQVSRLNGRTSPCPLPATADLRLSKEGGRRVTPSAASSTSFAVNSALSVEEFTVEANPATVEDAKAELLVASGVTRVSMGAQSFFPGELATLERLHSPDDIAPSVQILRRHGALQINLDLIFGIPGQTLDTWRESLKRAIELGPDHIACYGLTFEPATRLTAQRNAGRVTPCDEDLEADMFLMTIDVLESAGYRQYEISNYAKPGCECRHNLIYWRNQPYIGVGPSAAGCYVGSDGAIPARRERSDEGVEAKVEKSKSRKVEMASTPPDGSHENLTRSSGMLRRYKNVPDVAEYTRRMERANALAGPAAPRSVAPGLRLAEMEAENIDADTLALEMILMQLRLSEGLSIADFAARTGIDPLEVFEPALSRLVERQSLEVTGGHIALTSSGRLIANRVMDELASCIGQRRLPLPVL